ncbi:MAG: hypothetical protein JSU05_08545 [Bacteroidetes bacterium]|nr:hypothetical protein [Bacteroidota bacterium]
MHTKILSLANLPSRMSRAEMKEVNGGLAPNSCKTNSDCGSGEKCISLPGLPSSCETVQIGTTCSGDSDCGNGQSCVSKPVGSGKWCNTRLS